MKLLQYSYKPKEAYAPVRSPSAPEEAGAAFENYGTGKQVLRKSLYFAELVDRRTGPKCL